MRIPGLSFLVILVKSFIFLCDVAPLREIIRSFFPCDVAFLRETFIIPAKRQPYFRLIHRNGTRPALFPALGLIGDDIAHIIIAELGVHIGIHHAEQFRAEPVEDKRIAVRADGVAFIK